MYPPFRSTTLGVNNQIPLVAEVGLSERGEGEEAPIKGTHKVGGENASSRRGTRKGRAHTRAGDRTVMLAAKQKTGRGINLLLRFMPRSPEDWA